MLALFVSLSVHAGRSGKTQIKTIIVKSTWIELYTVSQGGCGTDPNRWHLNNDHPNYQAMYSGLLASKTTGKNVDIVGKNICGVAEEIDWAYVVD